MSPITAHELIDAVMGRLIAGRSATVFTGVSIDSRSVRKGNLFIAIVGKRLDGHDFVSEAVQRGAAGAVVSREGFLGKLNGEIVVVAFAQNTPGGGSVHALPMAKKVIEVWNRNRKQT